MDSDLLQVRNKMSSQAKRMKALRKRKKMDHSQASAHESGELLNKKM
jgi:hypothetical protein